VKNESFCQPLEVLLASKI